MRQLLKISDIATGSDAQEIDPNQLVQLLEPLLEMTDSDGFPWMLPGMRKSVLAKIALFHGEVEQAKEHLLEALQTAEEKQFPPQQIKILQLLAGVHRELDEAGQAREALLTAIRIEEDLESGLQIQNPMMMTLDQRQHRSIEQLIQYDAWQKRSWDALASAEGLKARTLRHWLGTEKSDRSLEPKGIPKAQVESLQRQLRQLEKLSAEASGERRVGFLEALETKRRDLANLLIRRQLRRSQRAGSAADPPLTLETLRARLLQQPDTALLSYFATWKELLIWVIDRRRFQMIRVEIGRQELTEKIRGIVGPLDRVRLSTSGLRGAEWLSVASGEGLEELYELLIAPVRPYLDEHQRLIVVPHSALHTLPFAALRHPESGRYLVEDFVLAGAPSLQALDVLLQGTPSSAVRSPLILGNPQTELVTLPGAEREAHRVASILGSDPVLGRDARESLLRQRLTSANVLHVAAHGIHNERDPYFSRLELAADPGLGADGHLEVYEILTELDFGSLDLVVLSGCQTALGDVTPGDEIVSLGRAFLYAGSPAVVSTLWSVDDEASSALMEIFYRRLHSGLSMAEALRAGQLHVLNQSATRDPYFWAGYVVEGDASRTLP